MYSDNLEKMLLNQCLLKASSLNFRNFQEQSSHRTADFLAQNSIYNAMEIKIEMPLKLEMFSTRGMILVLHQRIDRKFFRLYTTYSRLSKFYLLRTKHKR